MLRILEDNEVGEAHSQYYINAAGAKRFFVPGPEFQQSQNNQAEPEVNGQSQIDSGSVVTGRRRQKAGAGKVERIADQHRRQRSPEVRRQIHRFYWNRAGARKVGSRLRKNRWRNSRRPGMQIPWRGMPELDTEVQFLKGIGPRVAETLAAKGIRTGRPAVLPALSLRGPHQSAHHCRAAAGGDGQRHRRGAHQRPVHAPGACRSWR